ncbi:hypothetical protein BBO99_00008889 [Phytophthora kernoviae]|uniref:RxLR effector protein n=2 Tax=Phytophthora kernoviae TaxID=325452 RepID=A0A3R7G195_9STRA|nr:hypothetical protein G195_010426 [Phytophthora kernoviae 00238/432]KAG2509778.1 hypothetical protein JM16_008636 [Phytophthora kernoviae]KAG2511553.1 hypothetical protein JM18_008659 [Phytophthora kernoviae]RLN14398.1 hypothetical protein BBI17_008912 [Phytophthora kernoviae]RLN74537.1 hypothetical protein BBO99_00008889 [Phytophthora kernoviae]
MHLSCILLVIGITLLATINALPASTNSDQTMVSKVGADNGKRLLRSVNTADGDDSNKGQDEERVINFGVLFGVQSVDDAVTAAIAAAPAVMTNKEFHEKLANNMKFRQAKFSDWKHVEKLLPEQVTRFMEMYSKDARFVAIAKEYGKFYSGLLSILMSPVGIRRTLFNYKTSY